MYTTSAILDQPLNSICKEIDEKFTGLNTYTNAKYPDYIFYGKTKENIVIDYNSINKICYIDNKHLWLFFRSKYGMYNRNIKIFITWYVVNILKIDTNFMFS